jgi:hypothetical protein
MSTRLRMRAHGPRRCSWRSAAGALAVLAASLTPGPAAAQTKTGTTLGQFLLIEPSSRLTALGNAGVAVESGLEGTYYNPAAAGRISRLALEFTHIDWFAGIRFDYVAAALPAGDWGTGFITLASLNSGEIDVRTVSQPLGTGERYSVSDLALGLGFSRAITDRFSAGVHVKYLQETVWHSSARTVTFDIGTLYRVAPNGLHIGSSVSHFGTEARFSGRDLRFTYDSDPSRYGDNESLPGERFVQSYPVPVLFRVGAAYPWRPRPDWTLWATTEAVHPNDNTESMSAGAEASYRDLVALRAGYQGLNRQDSEAGLTLGTGIKGRLQSFDYRIDYAWADQGRLGSVHRVTLQLSY